MKTDRQLQLDVGDELKWDPRIEDSEIAVGAKDGVVTISGAVKNYAQKYAAERAVERVNGVKAIADELTIKLPSIFERSDTDLAHAALRAFEWDIEVPQDGIKVRVEKGWITLEGTVEWAYQRSAAERAVRYLTGVKGVTNHIMLNAKPSSVEVSKKIKAALHRNAELEADRITVEAADGKVTLRGTVRSFSERKDAEFAAWSAPGVMAVDDKLTVMV